MLAPITLPLSVVIIASNEEERIGECLDSVSRLVDDIVVVDAHSRDTTVAIAASKGARIFQRSWVGYSDQKNFGNDQARHDWILSLDADERISPELAESLRRTFVHGEPDRAAFAIRFQSYFGTRRVRFGAWNPEWHLRIFDRRKCDWNDVCVHEGLRGVEGFRVGRLEGVIRHYTVASRVELTGKMVRYSDLFAAKLRVCGQEPGWSNIWLNPVWRFARDYILRLGVLDGAVGFIIAWEAACYTHSKYVKARNAWPCPYRPVVGVFEAESLIGLVFAASFAFGPGLFLAASLAG